MLAVRNRIKEIDPEVVVCQSDAYRVYAEKLLEGVNIPIHVLDEIDMHAMWFRSENAVWIGDNDAPVCGRFSFIESFPGGLGCS